MYLMAMSKVPLYKSDFGIFWFGRGFTDGNGFVSIVVSISTGDRYEYPKPQKPKSKERKRPNTHRWQ